MNSRLEGILATPVLSGPQVTIDGESINAACFGVLEAITVSVGILEEGLTWQPQSGVLLVAWNNPAVNGKNHLTHYSVIKFRGRPQYYQ